MKTTAKLSIVVLVTALTVGCVEEQCAAACSSFEGLHVSLSLGGVSSTYDVDLLLDGAAGAFTCTLGASPGRWSVTDPTGNVPVERCRELGFQIDASPASVEILVNAQDGSWTGAAKESPTYERRNVCGSLCPPTATVTLPTLACINQSDERKITDPNFETEHYDPCVEQELRDPEPVAACLEEEPPALSPGCAVCYGLWTGCASNCIEPCVITPMPGPCQDCMDRAGCLAEFEACSGLDDPFPGSQP